MRALDGAEGDPELVSQRLASPTAHEADFELAGHAVSAAAVLHQQSERPFSGPLAETVQLGNVATRVAQPPIPKRGSNVVKAAPPLQWDAANLRITNNPAAHALLTKSYRAGWEVPAA